MDIINLALLFVGLINFIWGITILLLAKDKKINKSFSLVIFSVVFWTMTMVASRMNIHTQLFWDRMVYLAATCIPISFIFFTDKFRTIPPFKNIIKKSLLLIIWGVIALISILTSSIIKSTIPVEGKESIIIFGFLYNFYQIYIVGYFILAFINLYRAYKENTGINRIRILYVFWGSLVSVIIGCTTNLFMLTFGYFELNWVGQFATIFWFAIVTYSIIKYRFFDIRIIFRKGLIYIITGVITFISLYLFYIIGQSNWQNFDNNKIFIYGITIALIFTIFIFITQNFLKKIMYENIFNNIEKSHRRIILIGDEIRGMMSIKSIANIITGVLFDNLKIKNIAFISYIDGNQEMVEMKGENNVYPNLPIDLIDKFSKNEIMIYDELIYQGKLSALTEYMKENQIQIIIPLKKFSGKAIALILIGEKKNKNYFTQEEIEILEDLGMKISIALENAKLYKNIEDISKILKVNK